MENIEYQYEIYEGNFNLYERDKFNDSEKGKNILIPISQVPNQEGNLEKTLLAAFDKVFGHLHLPINHMKFKARDLYSDKCLEGFYPTKKE